MDAEKFIKFVLANINDDPTKARFFVRDIAHFISAETGRNFIVVPDEILKIGGEGK